MFFKSSALPPRSEYAQVLRIGLPLVVSMASTTIMQFTDRVFLGNYSLETMAAAGPAGIASYVPVAFFLGAGSYVNVFIAQYSGAGMGRRTGPSLWAGLYFCLLAGVILACLSFAAKPLFNLGGHPEHIQALEIIYFRIMTLGGVFSLLLSVMACFFSGRGLTRPVMLVNLIVASLNIPLDYMLINGIGPFPEWGIAGAAIATVFSWIIGCIIFAWLIFTPLHQKRFNVIKGYKWDGDLFKRLLRFGVPSGVQFFVDVIFFALFLFLVGRMGVNELAVSNIVLSINQLAFLPMIGLHIVVSTLVGQAQGAQNPAAARQTTSATVHMTLLYMGAVALSFIIWPEFFLELFRPKNFTQEDFAIINQMGTAILRLVAFYCLFDSLGIIYSGSLRGAGDTAFVMKVVAILAVFSMAIPTYLVVEVFKLNIIFAWACLTAYVCLLGMALWWRWRSNGWEKIKVIEDNINL